MHRFINIQFKDWNFNHISTQAVEVYDNEFNIYLLSSHTIAHLKLKGSLNSRTLKHKCVICSINLYAFNFTLEERKSCKM